MTLDEQILFCENRADRAGLKGDRLVREGKLPEADVWYAQRGRYRAVRDSLVNYRRIAEKAAELLK